MGDLARARDDVGVFAEALVGEALWPHQLEVARHPARIRVVCSGRQAGKSRTLAVLALHEAYRAPDRRVLIVSAGEDAARDLLAECVSLSSSPLLAGSRLDDTKSWLVLSNGSTIRSVPASAKQVRGKAVDLLVLDEAAFIDAELWQAAKYTVAARPGSKVVLASTPYGRRDGWFSVEWRAGERGVAGRAAFHWPSTVSPMVDAELLAMWRETATEREFRAEVLAEWVDDAGAVFSSELIEAAAEEYELVAPEAAEGLAVSVGGIDWGKVHDASALVLVAARGETWWLPWLVERFAVPYSGFIDTVTAAARGFSLRRLMSEETGVGAGPTEFLARRLAEEGIATKVVGVHTTAQLKEDAFGTLRLLLEQGRLRLPRHPALLRQLSAAAFETTESGATRIAVPERFGHDDLLMALVLAVWGLRGEMRRDTSALVACSPGSLTKPGWNPPGVASARGGPG